MMKQGGDHERGATTFQEYLNQEGYERDGDGPSSRAATGQAYPDEGHDAGAVLAEFRLGIATVIVVLLVLVTVFWRDRGEGEPGEAQREDALVFEARAKRAEAAIQRARTPEVIELIEPEPEPRGETDPNPDRPAADDTPRPPVKEMKEKVHVIKSGETLGEIARLYYGNPNQWKRIATANKIRRPERIRVGQKLKIPANKPAQAPQAPRAAPPARRTPLRRPPTYYDDPFDLTRGQRSL